MTELEKKLMALFGQVIPTMTEREQERFLDFGEGMAFIARQRTPTPPAAQARPGARREPGQHMRR